MLASISRQPFARLTRVVSPSTYTVALCSALLADMESAFAALPDDIASLQALILVERAERLRVDAGAARLQAEVARLTALNERLDHIIAQLRRLQFGRRSEALDPDQLQLGLEDLEGAAAEVAAEEEKGDAGLQADRVCRRHAARPSLPEHLPRVEMVIEPASTSCPCCAGPLHKIGEDIARRLDVVPAQYRVLVTRRPKYACRACEGAVLQAPAPARLIEGGLPTERLVAQVLVAKYADHCTAKRRVSPGPASSSTAQLWHSGPAMPRPS